MAVLHHFEHIINEDHERPDLLEHSMTVDIAYSYSPGYPERRYLPNGDPGYPGESPSVEIYSITTKYKGRTVSVAEEFPEVYEEFLANQDLETMILESHEEESSE